MGILKAPTGIAGFDEITYGGLPRGRQTLVVGGAGCGKTLFALECLYHGARDHGEPGVFICFEETARELLDNTILLGWDLDDLIRRELLVIDHVLSETDDYDETGHYDLGGLFARILHHVDRIGAKRLVLDAYEALWGRLTRRMILLDEFRRLMRFLAERDITSIITAARGHTTLTRQGLDEYTSDCVILLDHRTNEQSATRFMRVVKYRGSPHGTNEYPFLIEETGFSVLPLSSLRLEHPAPETRRSTGLPQLDDMLEGKGFYQGSSILVSGMAGAGKTSLLAQFTHAACADGDRCMFFSMEESSQQILRNMRSIGIDLAPFQDQGLLEFRSIRPGMYGLEAHLTAKRRAINEFKPNTIVFDPISNLTGVGQWLEVRSMLTRLIDLIKSNGITAIFSELTGMGSRSEQAIGISSLMDVWIMLRVIETGGRRLRTLSIVKARGIDHSFDTKVLLFRRQGIRFAEGLLGAAV